jgi:hypothetical protein
MVDSGFYTKKQFRIIGCQEDQKSIDAAVKRINQEKVDEGAVPRCSQI